jgi:hypothetical protein
VVFEFCPNNPSLPSDPPECSTDVTGPDGTPDGTPDPIRIGDLRFHLAEVVPNPQLSSPFGYGPSAADPTGSKVALADGELALGAGEIVEGNAFVYEHVLDRVAHQVADLVQLLNGATSPEDFVDGEDVAAWVEAVNGGGTQALAGSTHGVPDRWSREDVEQRLDLASNGFQFADGWQTEHDGGGVAKGSPVFEPPGLPWDTAAASCAFAAGCLVGSPYLQAVTRTRIAIGPFVRLQAVLERRTVRWRR